VHRAEEDVVARREDVVGAVAVVDVPVDDHHALQPVGVQRMLSGHGDAVDQAEAHRAGGAGVVARWAVQRGPGARRAAHQRVDQGGRPARSVAGGGVGAGRDRGVHVDHPAATQGQALDAIDVRERVDGFQERMVGGGGLDDLAAQPVLLGQCRLDGGDARCALGVRTRVVPCGYGTRAMATGDEAAAGGSRPAVEGTRTGGTRWP
jgi:hypothetical protein